MCLFLYVVIVIMRMILTLIIIIIIIGNLINLNRLDLAYNHLTTLPLQIYELKYLKYLYLNNNKLEAISEEIGKLCNSLVKLRLQHNELITLPKSIGKCYACIACCVLCVHSVLCVMRA